MAVPKRVSAARAQRALFAYEPSAGALAGRVILITGASRGIGRAVTLASAAAGAETLLLGRDVGALENAADLISGAGHPAATIIPLDLEGAAIDDYRHVGELVARRWGRLDGLVVNAAMLGELARIRDYDPLIWARVMQVNLNSAFLLLAALLPELEKAPDASIVLTSSSVGRRGRAFWGGYAVSKFGLEGLMQTLADELDQEPGIRVNSLNPGRVRTRMRAAAYPAEDPTTLDGPESIAHAYVFLLGPASRGIHGLALDAQPPAHHAHHPTAR